MGSHGRRDTDNPRGHDKNPMTDDEQRIYARMSRREQEAIDALSPELQPAMIAVWARVEARPMRRHASTRLQPDRTTLAPADFNDPRLPPERDDR